MGKMRLSKEKTQMKEAPSENAQKLRVFNIRWRLVFYDLLMYLAVSFMLLFVYNRLTPYVIAVHMALGAVCIFGVRFIAKIYKQIWRYGGTQAYIRMVISDAAAFWIYYLAEAVIRTEGVTFVRILSVVCMNLLGAMAMRMIYSLAYQISSQQTPLGKFLRTVIGILGGVKIKPDEIDGEAEKNKIKIAIVGAGRVGVTLAEELMGNPHASYIPCCFIDVSPEKAGRQVCGLLVLSEAQATAKNLNTLGVQEVVFALPQMDGDEKKKLYDYYKGMGCKVKVYDYPVMRAAGNSKRSLREFDIEELLFRKQVDFTSEETNAYYRGKVILITGGGGSIGSELCRQLAKMEPKTLVIADICENGAYDIQQELKIAYSGKLDFQVEIVSVCDRAGLEKVFDAYRPQIVLNAAAHKHVPLMERNCCEAVKNNVFGTLNTVELSEKYGVERFIMVSTDKAVNPTNVMGATKRMCEMIVQSHSQNGSSTVYSATRFGNVLGSAGSVIPLFKRQILNGGPITITDKRIIRYFMTIPEASQLVLQSGAMAKNGELFVLDMGKPVKILELAENMVRLAGMEPYRDINIVEIGLRPGEKLYEELLIRTEELDKTENSMIFVERDSVVQNVEEKIAILRKATETEDSEIVKAALKQVIPEFRSPEEVNAGAADTREMRMVENRDKQASGEILRALHA